MSVGSPAKKTKASLGDLGAGDTAVIEHVRCARPTAVRLMEMGLCKGTRVEVLRVAPLGDPMELFVSGYSLSIRRAEALGVKVQSVVESAPHAALATARPRELERDRTIAMAQAEAPPSVR
jgi:ferrous iron transport protein A